MTSFQLCRTTGQKRQNWYHLAAYTSAIIGGNHVCPLQVTAAGVFPHVTMLDSHCVFFPLVDPVSIGLSLKNRDKSFFYQVINSSVTSLCSIYKDNFILQCLHANISWESTHIGWSRTCSIGFITSHKVIVGVMCIMLFFRMANWRNWWSED